MIHVGGAATASFAHVNRYNHRGRAQRSHRGGNQRRCRSCRAPRRTRLVEQLQGYNLRDAVEHRRIYSPYACTKMKCREVVPRINAWRVTATLVGALILGGCNQDAATARLANDIQPDKVEIIHARFPCRSPEMHFFGYRFRILVKTEMALGDICWDPLAKEWTWQILPEYGLSRLNLRK
jgi:hypothetical protein